jgi:hypothetical protein
MVTAPLLLLALVGGLADPLDAPVTLSLQDASLLEVMEIVETICQRKVSVVPPIAASERVSIEVRSQSVKVVLDRLLSERGHAWRLVEPDITLLEPQDGAVAKPGSSPVEFSWRPRSEADSYRIIVAAMKEPSRPRVRRDVHQSTVGLAGLEPGRYTWRVEALMSGKVLFSSPPRVLEIRRP